MSEIRDRRDQQSYTGRNWGSIARRVWGRSAEVQAGQPVEPGSNLRFGSIVKRDPAEPARYTVLADVVLR